MRIGLAFALLMALQPSASAANGRIFTLWPLVDYRRSEAVDYTSWNLLGPIVTYERKGDERAFGIRPFYSHALDPVREVERQEILYPIASRKSEPNRTFTQSLHLLQHDTGDRTSVEDTEQFMFFPFIFSGDSPERGSYFAFFPFWGKLYDRFGRDEIHFTLFPLYARTELNETTNTHFLWPFFRKTEGEEVGAKLWPLFGTRTKEGVYRKRFYLWPLFFSQDLDLDTDQPRHLRGFFPLYLREESPQLTSRTWLWPFFSHVENRQKGYEELNFPWPLARRTVGENRQGVRVLPLFSDERTGDFRKRWLLWPVYKREELNTEILERRRHRILFFLYSDLQEHVLEEEQPRLRRVALWPLFTYERKRAVSHFYTLSLLEPFFPRNEGIERNWSPLWRLYQRKWDEDGNEISSFLWNLYWKERRGDDVATEFFPLYRYQREQARGEMEFSVLKGLFRMRRDSEGRRLHLLYLPWGIPAGGGTGTN